MTTVELLSVLDGAVNKKCKIGLRQINIVNVTSDNSIKTAPATHLSRSSTPTLSVV